jgi:hypothetical protein
MTTTRSRVSAESERTPPGAPPGEFLGARWREAGIGAMPDVERYRTVLELTAPWTVVGVDVDLKGQRAVVRVETGPYPCPEEAARAPWRWRVRPFRSRWQIPAIRCCSTSYARPSEARSPFASRRKSCTVGS